LRQWRPIRVASETPQAQAATPSLAAPFFLQAEDAVLHALALPNLPPSQRRTAAIFAVEDQIAQPLEQVRVVLGPQFPEGSGTWLVAVVDQAVLARAMGHAGLARPVLAAVMQVPVPDSGWSVAQSTAHLLIRRPDGSGFAVDSGLARQLWQMQGAPTLTGYGEGLPDELPFAARLPLPDGPDLPVWSFDLAATTGRRPSYVKRSRWLWAIGFGMAAITTHLALMALDVSAQKHLAAQSLQTLAQAVAPFAGSGEDPVTTATRVLAAQGAATAPAFLTLAASAIGTLPPPQSGVSLRSLRFDEATGALVLAVIAPDIPALQAVEAALTAAGHLVAAGPASSRNGAAEAEMTITGGASP
jgi:general secretion pathway protein L